MKCLIVEDNAHDRRLLQQMLTDYGQTDTAENGAEAIEQFKRAHMDQEPYDVIFLDIMMPGVDGNEILRQIRDLERNTLRIENPVSIVMATSKTDTDTIVTSYDDGCQHFFMKPYDKRELIELLSAMGF